jgi:hypothetical protein
MDNLKVLASAMGTESAEKVIKLTNNYDKYVDKFKKELNTLLAPIGYEVKVGVAFVKKESSDEKK